GAGEPGLGEQFLGRAEDPLLRRDLLARHPSTSASFKRLFDLRPSGARAQTGAAALPRNPIELPEPCRLNPRPHAGFSMLIWPSPQRAAPARRGSMALERTLSIIKPDAVAKNVIGEIYSRFEKAGL